MKAVGAIVMAAVASAGLMAQQRDGPQAPPTGTARIHGRVVDAGTGVRVRAATVTLSSPGTGGWVATTDDEGRFDFPGLPSGQFSIRVTKNGFVPTPFPLYRQPSLNSELKPGQQLDRGDLRVPRGGVIAGRVIDEHGDAAIEVGVQAWRVDYTSPGTRRLVTGGSAQTNDLGEFRVYGLRPGTYYVSATFREFQVSVSDAGIPATQFLNFGQGFLPTFHPGTAIVSDAQPVVVAAGETISIGFGLLSARLARVSGRAVDSRGQPARNFLVMLNPARADGTPFFSVVATEVDARGEFTIPNVAPGDYRVDLISKARLEAIGQTGSSAPPPGGQPEFASQPLTVNDDVSDLIVQTGLGFEMRGRVLLDDAPAPAALVAKMQIQASPLIQGQGVSATLMTASSTARPDGTFVVRGLIGSRMIRLIGLPAGVALKSVTARGVDVTDDGLEIGRGIDDVDIAITTTPTTVTGHVTDASGAPTRDYAVIIFSDDNRRWTTTLTRHVVSARSAADGRFRVSGLPAGGFLAVAVDELEQGQWAAPDNLERLRARATPFSLTDGETHTLALVRR